MLYTKKKMKLNSKESGEYTIEEILEKYEPYIKKISSYYFNYLSKFIGHAVCIDFEDLEQICRIGIIKAYEGYDIGYTNSNTKFNNESDPIGFFPYMEQKAHGELRRYCRDLLQQRRKDINPALIKLDSIYKAVNNRDKGNEEILLMDVIPQEENCYEDLENKLELERLLSFIPKRDKDIVIDSYINNMSQTKIGEKYNISQAEVSRTIKRSIKRMKEMSNKKEAINLMKTKKVKTLDFDSLFDYLRKGIEKHSTLDKAIDAYCNKSNVLIEDAYQALNKRKATCETLKELYANKNKSKAVKEIKKTSEPTSTKTIKSIETNVFDDIKIVNLTVDLEGMKVNFSPSGISLSDLKLEDLSVDDLKKIQKSIQKAIEINSTIYK